MTIKHKYVLCVQLLPDLYVKNTNLLRAWIYLSLYCFILKYKKVQNIFLNETISPIFNSSASCIVTNNKRNFFDFPIRFSNTREVTFFLKVTRCIAKDNQKKIFLYIWNLKAFKQTCVLLERVWAIKIFLPFNNSFFPIPDYKFH